MPWLTFPFEDKRIEKLSSRFEVQGIPTLVILSPEGEVITKSGRQAIGTDPRGAKFPYYPPLVGDLTESSESFGFDLNEVPALIAFIEALDDGDQDSARATLATFATTLTKDKALSPDGPEMIFFVSSSPGGLGQRIRDHAKLKGNDPAIMILDIPDNGGFYLLEHREGELEINEATVSSFIQSYKAKTLDRQQLG